jgi:cytochrome c oxidase subunit 2
MNELFSMPPEASDFAARSDTLFWAMAGTTGAVAVGIFVLLTWFSIRFRRGAAVTRSPSGSASGGEAKPILAILWIVVPLLIFLTFYVWAAWLYLRYQSPSPRPLQIYVVAKQWMWTLEQPNGRREINELHVPRNRGVKLVMTSQDVIHSFYVPAFRIKRDVLPGRYEVMLFTPTRSGDYHLFCSEYCGTDHAHMGGRIVVMEPEAYARWLETGSAQTSLAALGAAKFRSLGCGGCHGAGAAVRAPPLERLYGSTVPLANSRFVKVDERYVRDSILLPSSEVAAGYEDLMPSYTGRVSEEEVLELIEYIKSLAPAAADTSSEVVP